MFGGSKDSGLRISALRFRFFFREALKTQLHSVEKLHGSSLPSY